MAKKKRKGFKRHATGIPSGLSSEQIARVNASRKAAGKRTVVYLCEVKRSVGKRGCGGGARVVR